MLWNKLNIKKRLGILFFSIPSFLFSQQNLIINSGLDSISNCPSNTDQLDLAFGWEKYAITSPDLFNSCSTDPLVGINSEIGHQFPLSDSGFLHLGLFYEFSDTSQPNPYRESAIGTFKQTLENKKYIFECYINFSSYNQNINDNRLAINLIQIKLLDSIKHPIYGFFPYMDTSDLININSVSIINDTLNWLKLRACFKATGNEKYFAIGCFGEETEILKMKFGNEMNGSPFLASYYFDSFSLIECDTFCGNITPIEPFNESLDIANSASTNSKPIVFTANLLENSYAKMEIYDSRGGIVERHTFTTNDNLYTPSINLQKALYHYRFETENGFYQSGKFVVVE